MRPLEDKDKAVNVKHERLQITRIKFVTAMKIYIIAKQCVFER